MDNIERRETTVQEVCTVLNVLHEHPDSEEKRKAAMWLEDLQKSMRAWQVADDLLHQPEEVGLEAFYFGAQTLRTKIQYDFLELPPESHESLRESLFSHLTKFRLGPAAISMQLALAVADMAVYMESWKNSVDDVIKALGAWEIMPCVLDILTVLPEEVGNDSLRVSGARRWEVSEEFGQSSSLVLQYLAVAMENSGGAVDLQLKIFRCLSSWIRMGSIPVMDLRHSPLLIRVFEALRGNGGLGDADDLFDEACEVICSALFVSEDTRTYMPVVEMLWPMVMSLYPLYKRVVESEDEDRTYGLVRVFTELGESYLDIIVSHAADEKAGTMVAIQILLECTDNENVEISEMTFHFWYSLIEKLYKIKNHQREHYADLSETIVPPFTSYLQRLIDILVNRAQYPPDIDTLPDQKDDFALFRNKISDLLIDVTSIIGSWGCLMQLSRPLLMLDHQQEGAGSAKMYIDSSVGGNWQQIEAVLFSMAAIAPSIKTSESEIVHQLLDYILNTMPTEDKLQITEYVEPALPVQHSSIILVGEFAPWLDEHPQYIEPMLSFLCSTLSNAELVPASAVSVKKVCTYCGEKLSMHVNSLLSILESVDQLQLGAEDVEEMLKGTCRAIAALPLTDIPAAMEKVIMPILTPLREMLLSGDEGDLENREDPSLYLDRIGVVYKYVAEDKRKFNRNNNNSYVNLANPGNVGSSHPCLSSIKIVYGVVIEVFPRYSNNSSIMELCCRCLKYIMRCVGVEFGEYLSHLVNCLVHTFSKDPHSCFLYLGSICVDVFGGLSDKNPYNNLLVKMLESFSETVFRLLNEEGFENLPDVVEDYYGLCDRFLTKGAPMLFLESPLVSGQGAMIECALTGICMAHREANVAIVKFMRHFIDLYIKYTQRSHSGSLRRSTSILACIPTESLKTRAAIVDAVLRKYCSNLIHSVISGITGNLPSFAVPELACIVYDLLLWNRPQSAECLVQAFEAIPVNIMSEESKSQMLNEIIQAQEEKAVRDCLKALSRVFRRKRYDQILSARERL
eukprot:Nk52_evm22s211 gene=Nk52_evmTU22s211